MLSKTPAHKSFQDDAKFHRREWRAERIGWLVLFAFISAALLGLFGKGPLSHKIVGDARTATLVYERFLRFSTASQLELAIAKSGPGSIAVEMNESYLRDVEITSITPNPSNSTLLGDRHRFEFDLVDAPATIVIRITPDKVGTVRGSFIVAGTRLDFSQFVYP